MELPEHIKIKHFLVCDDYESMRTLVTEELRAMGIEHITLAKSGNEGYALIQSMNKLGRPIEFVITDLMMEDGSGLELTALVRKSPDPRVKSLPVLMLTSKAEINYVLQSLKAGVNNYIVKPWTQEDLAKRIIEVCNKLKI